eukprot:gene34366-biopygen27210
MKSVAVPRLSKDQFLEQNMEILEKLKEPKERTLFRKYIAWIPTLTESYGWSDVYDFHAQVRDDYEQGRLATWDPVPLAFKFQYSFAETLGDAQKHLTEERGEADYLQYKHDVAAVGARVSPLTERVDRWAQAAWGLPGAEEVVRGVATGFRWQQEQPTELFRVENYVPLEHQEKVQRKLLEEEDAGGMVRSDAGSVPGISALGIVFTIVQGKVKERIVHDLSSLEFRDVVRIDTRFPFGAKAAPGLFSNVTVLISRMLQSRGFPGVVVYLGDFLLVADSEEACRQGFEMLIELVEYLGFDVAPERVQQVAAECRHVAGLQKVRVKEVERLVGQLMFYARVVYGAKMFLRTGYGFQGRARRMRKFFDKVPEAPSQDLPWLARMLQTNNGMGGFLGGRWFTVKWEEAKRWKVLPYNPFRDEASSHINYLELFEIFWALTKWGHLLRGCKTVLWSDNEAGRRMTENPWKKATFAPLLKEILHSVADYEARFEDCDEEDFVEGQWSG